MNATFGIFIVFFVIIFEEIEFLLPKLLCTNIGICIFVSPAVHNLSETIEVHHINVPSERA